MVKERESEPKHGKASRVHESCNLGKQINYVLGKTFGRSSAWRVCLWTTDLFDALPPAAYKRPAFHPQICKAPWPLYTSAGISLCETPDGKLQLLALYKEEEDEEGVRKKKDYECHWLSAAPGRPPTIIQTPKDGTSARRRRLSGWGDLSWAERQESYYPPSWQFTNN